MSNKSRRRPQTPRRMPSTGPREFPIEALPATLGLSRDAMAQVSAPIAAAITQAAYKGRALAAGGHPESAVAAVVLAPYAHLYQAMDAAATLLTAPGVPPHGRPACTSGCHWCCRLYVEISPLKAFGIALALPALWAGMRPTLPTIEAEMRAALTRESVYYGHTGFQHHDRPTLCAFLTPHGTCGVYPVRPSACRTYYSSSAAACQRYFTRPHMTGDHPVLRGPAEMTLALALTVAEMQALGRPPFPPTGLPSYEMQSAVARILDTPQALTRYLHGEDIFQGCIPLTAADTLRDAQQLWQLSVPPLPVAKEEAR